MDKHIQLSAEAEAQFEEGGGIKKETQLDRDRVIKMFKDYVLSESNRTVETLIQKGTKLEEDHQQDLDVLSYHFSKYFWTLRVDVTVWSLKSYEKVLIKNFR